MPSHVQLLTDDQMRRFIIDGYVTLKTDLLRELHESIYQTTRHVYDKEGNPGNNLLPRVPLVQRVFDCPQVQGALTSILGSGYYMQPHRHAHIRCRDSEKQKMHLDTGDVTRRDNGRWLWRPHRPRTVLAFYYPQDTPLEIGPTEIVAKGHYYPHRSDGDTKHATPLCCDAGTVVIAHYEVWHRSMGNRTDKVRFMIKFLFSRMTEPDRPAWDCRQSAWQTQKDDGPVDRNRIWSHQWNWHSGRPDATATGSADHKLIAEWVRKLGDELDPMGVDAAYALGEIGAPAVAALVDALGSESDTVRRNACFALARVGAPAVPQLADTTMDPRRQVRAAALDVLMEIGPPASAALPQIVKALQDADPENRSRAAEALGTVGQADPNVAPALIKCLKDEDEFVRRHAALSLARLPSGAEEAVAGLVKTLDDENRYVVGIALEALKRIRIPEAMDALVAHLETARWCAGTTTENLY